MSVRQGNNTIAGAVGKYPLNERNITNCITNIPQDIKLELSNGTLTLKTGSKVYVPNGFETDGTTPKFDIVIIENDIQILSSNNNTLFLSLNTTNNSIILTTVNNGISGSGISPIAYGLVYDTSTNKITKYGASIQPLYNTSFPFAIITSNTTQIVSIDQVFNGFGYIGSTVFVLPGVKGLIPNGRNADGSLKSIEVTVNNVLTNTGSYNEQPQWIILNSNLINTWDSVYWIGYNSQENILFNKEGSSSATSGSKIMACVCAFLSADANQKITSFTPKKAFHAVDYNDTEYIAHQAMPSGRYVDLTLGASGSSYTAPADGWLNLRKIAHMQGQYMELSGRVDAISVASYDGQGLSVWIPVSKGEIVKTWYSASGTTERFRFVYANGVVQ